MAQTSEAELAVREFEALADEMARFRRGPSSARLATVKGLASRFNEALDGVPQPTAQGQALPQRSKHAYSMDWAHLTQRQCRAAEQLGWTRRKWDSHSSKPMEETKWDDLHAHDRLAAELLDFRSDVWDNPKGSSGLAANASTKYRCGEVYFKETKRSVPYLLVPRGAMSSADEEQRLVQHMRAQFRLDETFFTTGGVSGGPREGRPPNVILRVTPGEDLPRGAQGTRSISVASPSRTLNESVEVGRDDEEKHSLHVVDCISETIRFLHEYKGCFITSADRTTGIELIGRAIKRGDRNLNMHARADRCRPPVWWIAHHNLRHTEDEAEAVEHYKNRGVEELRDDCKRKGIRIPDLSHLRLDELREREILMDLLIANDLKAQGKDRNDLKAAIRRHSVPLDEGAAEDAQVMNDPHIIEESKRELHPYVSCLLFFEEEEENYEMKVEHLHHILQRNGIPEGLIATSIPDDDDVEMDTTVDTNRAESQDVRMILKCVQQDINRVPVLTLWATDQAREQQMKQRRKVQDELRKEKEKLEASVDATLCGIPDLNCCAKRRLKELKESKDATAAGLSLQTSEAQPEPESDPEPSHRHTTCCGCVERTPKEELDSLIDDIAKGHVRSMYATDFNQMLDVEPQGGTISDNILALDRVKEFREQTRFKDGDIRQLSQCAMQWHLLGTPMYPWNAQRLKVLAKVALQGDPQCVREVIPRNVFALLDNSDGEDTLRWLKQLIASENYGQDALFRSEQERAINETIKDIAKYRQNGARQDAWGDFCNVALLFLQFLSVLVIVFETNVVNLGPELADDWTWLALDIREWHLVLDWIITLIPCCAGLLVTIIAKFQFTRHAQALRWAAQALESELWRYRSRTGRYCARAHSWKACVDNETRRTFSAAHHSQKVLNAYVRRQRAIAHDKEIERYHANATMVEVTADQIADTRMRLFPFSTKEEYDDYNSKRPGYARSVWAGEESVLGAVWELYFEFLIFNEQDRIRSSLPAVCKGGRARDAQSGSTDACRGYCESLLWRLCVVIVCTVGAPLACILYVIGYIVIICLKSCLQLSLSCFRDTWEQCKWKCCPGGNVTTSEDYQMMTTSLDRAEVQVTGDQYYEVRYRAVYDDVKTKKRRHAHQHVVLLVLQAVINAAALVVSEPVTAAMHLHTHLSSDPAAYVDQPQMVIQKKLVGQPAPVPLCIRSTVADNGLSTSFMYRAELDDECTQVMRYASCEDIRCVSSDHLVSHSPYYFLTFCKSALVTYSFTRPRNDWWQTAFVAGADSLNIEETYPGCSLCAEDSPYPTWQQLVASTSTSTDMTLLCTGQGRVGHCTYEVVQAEPEAIDCGDDVGSTLQRGDLYVAPLTASLSFIMAMNAYFQVDRMLQSRNESRMRLQQLGKQWLSSRGIDPEWLAHKATLVDETEKAFMLTARGLHGGLDEDGAITDVEGKGDGDGDDIDETQQQQEEREEEEREEAWYMEEGSRDESVLRSRQSPRR